MANLDENEDGAADAAARLELSVAGKTEGKPFFDDKPSAVQELDKLVARLQEAVAATDTRVMLYCYVVAAVDAGNDRIAFMGKPLVWAPVPFVAGACDSAIRAIRDSVQEFLDLQNEQAAAVAEGKMQ